MVPVGELEGGRMRPAPRWITLAAVGVLAGALAYGLLKPASPTDPGAALPAFSLPLLSGRGVLTSDRLEGRPTVINFWASWCAPCREEMPLLERTWRTYEDRGIQFLGVNLRDSPREARAFVRKYDVSYPVVVDESQTLAKKLGIDGLPQTLFIDAEGRLVGAASEESEGSGAYLGAIDEATLEDRIRELLDATGEQS